MPLIDLGTTPRDFPNNANLRLHCHYGEGKIVLGTTHRIVAQPIITSFETSVAVIIEHNENGQPFKRVFGCANALDHLYRHHDDIPEEWYGKYVIFPGTVYVTENDDTYEAVRVLWTDPRACRWNFTALRAEFRNLPAYYVKNLLVAVIEPIR